MSALEACRVGSPGRLHPTDLVLAVGSLTTLVGPNGAGKTSLLHALAGIGRPLGAVRVRGRTLRRIAGPARAAMLGYVPAARELAWPLAVRDFVTLTAPAADADMLSELLGSLSLDDLAERRVDRLSTGERSRVLIARALLPRPAALLLDEPFANLDPLWQLRLAERLRAEATAGMAILVSVHDLDLAARLSQRMLVVDGGCVVADGEPDALVHQGVIARVFGVQKDSDGQWCPAERSFEPCGDQPTG